MGQANNRHRLSLSPAFDQHTGQQGTQTQPNPVPDANATPYPATPIPSLVIGGVGTSSLPIPRAAVVDKDGNIYIYTEGDSMIHKYAAGGAQITQWL